MSSFPLSPVGETYLVGGAVRDELLGIVARERDFVVVGATEGALLDAGFVRVSRNFPVYLHPETRDEYALARTERKTGSGYTGFSCSAGSEVTLEEDLLRRDLTINAMARRVGTTGVCGEIIDPHGGRRDLRQHRLRHVSDAFVEDPLRILRAARFLARFYHLGFRLVSETNALMAAIVKRGELESLAPERIWQETAKALMETTPSAYFRALHACGALCLFPTLAENAALRARSLASIEVATKRGDPLLVRVASMARHWPVAEVRELAVTLCWPVEVREISRLAAEYGAGLKHLSRSRPWQSTAWLDLLHATDALRRPGRFRTLLLAVCDCELPADCEHIGNWQSALQRVREISVNDLEQAERTDGTAIAAGMRRARLAALTAWMREQGN